MDFLSTCLPPIAISLAVILFAVMFLQEKNKRYPPVAGTVLHQLFSAPKVLHYATELACKYKTYRIIGLFRFAVYTTDPANVEYMLKTNVANYGKVCYHTEGRPGYLYSIPTSLLIHQVKATPIFLLIYTCMHKPP